MVLTKYNESICKIYIKQLLKYLDDVNNINFINNRNVIIFQGFNCLNKILMIIYVLEMSEEQINSYLEKAHMLYIEYTEQVFLKKEDVIHSPSMFVYNVLIGNISFESIKSNKDQFTLYLIKWSFLLSFWDSKNQETLKMDLWVKEMPLDQMKLFFHQTLVSLCDTFYKATQDEKMTDTMKDFCDYFAEKLELKRP